MTDMNAQSCSRLRRYILLLASLPVNALGIVLVTIASLGTSPISSLPYVISKLSPLSFGLLTWILNIIFVGIQAVFIKGTHIPEKKNYILWQIPILTVFSVFVDIWMMLFEEMHSYTYLSHIGVMVIGCLCLVVGISWSVKANVAMNPGEGIIKVLSERIHISFGWTKFLVDSSLVVISGALSWIYFKEIVGLREGTVVAAFLVGPLVRFTYPVWNFLEKWIADSSTVKDPMMK